MILQRYVLKQLLVSLCFAAGGILFVLLPAILVNAVHKVGSAGLDALWGYLPLVLAELVPYLLPLGFLLAVVTTFGRLAADREWTAVRMAGINPIRLLLPCGLVAIVLATGTDWLTSTVAPNWALRQQRYRREVLANVIKHFGPGRTEVRVPGFFLTAARRDPDHPVFYQAHISILQPGGGNEDPRDKWIYADRVSLVLDGNHLVVDLENARLIKGEEEGKGSLRFRLDLDQLAQVKASDPNRPKFLSSGEMRRRLATTEVTEEERGELTYEIHRRHSLAATYVLFLLLGFPTGIRLRRGTQLAAFAAAVAYAIVYYVLSLRLAQQLFMSGTLSAAFAPWITNAIACPLGAFLSWKVLRK